MMLGQDAEDILVRQTMTSEVRSVNVILLVACLVATSTDL
jgi:hypothetical protein